MAAATGRLRTFDFSFDLTNQYTFWSGTIAALFLFCSYFGADQSQVQRYLTARSVEEAQQSLLMSAYWKIPLQVHRAPARRPRLRVLCVQPAAACCSARSTTRGCARERRRRPTPRWRAEFATALEARRMAAPRWPAARDAGDPATLASARQALIDSEAAVQAVRTRATALARDARGDRTFTDINYIIPTFILTQLPIGLIGVLIVAILMAATDTIAAELNSLSTATVIDFYMRRVRPVAPDSHYLTVSKVVTGVWGLFACGVAVWAAELGSLIEVVNRFGSFFYGSILGVFILAVGFPRATATGAFFGLIAGMASVAWAASFTRIAFLWHNVIGAVVVVIVGLALSVVRPGAGRDEPSGRCQPNARLKSYSATSTTTSITMTRM